MGQMAPPTHKVIYLRFKSSTDGEWFAPAALRPRLVEEADTRASNVSAVIIEELSQHYGLEYDLTERRTHAGGDKDTMTIRLPVALIRAVDLATAGSDRSRSREILRVLSLRFDLAAAPVAA